MQITWLRSNFISRTLRAMPLWQYVAVIVAVCGFFMYLYMPYGGDDLNYRSVFEGLDPGWGDLSPYRYLMWIKRHWFNANGRLANFIVPALLMCPKWLVALVSAFFLWLMYDMVVRLTGVIKGMLPVSAVALCFFALPWWDSMQITDVQTNYIWASALSLLAVYLVLKVRKTSWPLMAMLIAICIAGGMMHESASLPLAAGVAVYLFVARRRLSGTACLLALSFGIGTAFALFAPGIMLRAENTIGVVTDDTLPLLVLKSCWAAVALWIVISMMAFSAKGRRNLAFIFHSSLCIFAVASLVGTVISAASGIVGRSGWFAQTAAIITAVGWVARWRKPRTTILAFFLATVVTGLSAGLAIWQYRTGTELNKAHESYMKSADGVVFMDVVRDYDAPWWTMWRLRCVYDANDVYLLSRHAAFYRADKRWMRVLPADAADVLPRMGDSAVLKNGDILLRDISGLPSIGILEADGVEHFVVRYEGADYVAQPVRGIWHLSPHVLNPGDRL